MYGFTCVFMISSPPCAPPPPHSTPLFFLCVVHKHFLSLQTSCTWFSMSVVSFLALPRANLGSSTHTHTHTHTRAQSKQPDRQSASRLLNLTDGQSFD